MTMQSVTGEIEDDITDVVAIHRCTECGREAAIYRACPPPRIEEMAAPQFWRKNQDGLFECLVYGDLDFPSWWFCPFTRFFGVTGAARARVDQPADLQ